MKVGQFWPAAVDVRVGREKVISGTDSRATLTFGSQAEARRILEAGDAFALAEAFVHGSCRVEGDIYAFVRLKDTFYPERLRLSDKSRIVFDVLRTYKPHTATNDRHFVSHHYDHPNEFYELFLGPAMTYSCAYFNRPDDALEKAQDQKIDHLLTKLRLREGERLLDIGCGWGSLVIKAARDYGASALGITLSRSQAAYAQKRIGDAGLSDRCRVELLDYRQLNGEDKFDKIVSVGMYEHVGGRNLDAYFSAVHDQLRPEGLFVNHGITRKPKPDWRRAPEARFIAKYIFPGGELHPSHRIIGGMEAAGFEVFDVESLRKHYALTLRRWVSNLQKREIEACNLVPDQVYRAWILYMAGCALTFEEGYLNVHQVSGSKSGAFGGRHIALTREHLYNKTGAQAA